MTRWRTIRTTLLATFAAAAVLAWPPHPAWRVPAGDGHLLGFTPDSGTVVRSHHPDGRDGGRVELVSHDAATGRVVATVPLPVATDRVQPWPRVALSPDGRRAVVYWHPGDPAPPGDRAWVLFDAATGTRVAAAPAGADRYLTAEFSPDGRWLSVYYDTATDDTQSVRVARELFDAATGVKVAAFAPTDRDHPRVLGFRDDGTAAVVLWLPDTRVGLTGPGYRGELVPLPAGAVRPFALPPNMGVRGVRWSGDRLTLFALAPTPAAPGYRWQCLVIDTAADPLGPAVEAPVTDASLDGGWTLDGGNFDPRLRILPRERAAAPHRQLLAWAAS